MAVSDYSYFDTGYLQGISHEDSAGAVIGDYSWDYDIAGRVSSFTAPEGTTAYTYDNTGQLISGVLTAAGVTASEENFDYDSTGNRLSQTTDGTTTSSLVSRNRLLSDGTHSYSYDASGNRTRKRETATGDYQDFTWDHRNRLTGVEFRSASGMLQQAVRYSYDAFDQRVLTEVDADDDGSYETIERAVWDRGEVSLVLDDAGSIQHRFLQGPGVDQVFADESATDGLLWYLTDNQNSVRDVVDSSGTLLNHLSYSTFGKITSESDDSKTPYFAYTGREFDEVTGLQYNRARYYDAETGRWLSNDPIGFAAGDANIQRYVGNSPTNATDPSGLIDASYKTWHHLFPQGQEFVSWLVGKGIDPSFIHSPENGWYLLGEDHTQLHENRTRAGEKTNWNRDWQQWIKETGNDPVGLRG